MKSFYNSLLSLFAIKFFQPFFETLHYISLKGMNYGSANDPKDSGELSLLKKIKNELPQNPVIFDVGSNNGQYLELLLEVFGGLNPVIHCFEPNLIAFEKLQKKFGNKENVFLNQYALGDIVSDSTLYSNREGGVQSSMITTGESSTFQEVVKIITLDQYAELHSIAQIDFLKIDTEGYESHVIRGAKSLIEFNKIIRIQLEHGSVQSIIANASLYSYQKMLPNFKLFHIKQNGIREIHYATRYEIYYNSNYYLQLK